MSARCRSTLWLVLSLLLLGSAAPAVRAQSEDEQLEQLLRRLGLARLQLRHHEQQFQASPPEQRLQRAQRLADLYAEQLVEAMDDVERYQELKQRVDQLLEEVPEAKTKTLEVMLLQTDYQRAESLIARAMLEASAPEQLGEAEQILARITPVLAEAQRELWTRVDELNEQFEKATNSLVQDQLEAELQRTLVLAGRAAYFAGWSYYYRGVLAQPAQLRDFESARAIFHRVLDLTAEDEKSAYQELDAELLGLESPWRARTLIGLGLCQAGLRNVEASRRCFALLTSDLVSAPLRQQVAYWQLQGLLNAGLSKEAVALVRQQLEMAKPPATQGQVSLFSAALRAGLHPWQGHAAQPELAALGKAGLAKLDQQRLLIELLTRYGGSLEEAEDFRLRWLRGQQLRRAADASKKAADYEHAAAALAAALESPDAKQDIVEASRCRMELAWCYYQLQRDAEAAALYQQSAEQLHAAKAAGAADAGWMVFVTRHRMTLEDDAQRRALSTALGWLKQEFPEHEYTKRAEFVAAKLKLREASPDEQRAALASVPQGDPNYVSARQQLCALLYEQWKEAPPEQRSSAQQQARQAIEETLALRSQQLDSSRRAELRLMLADMALHGEEPDAERAAEQLEEVERRVASGEVTSDELAAEASYRQLQLARAQSDTSAQRSAALWFVDHGAGTRWEAAGLIAAARELDQQYAQAPADARGEIAAQALQVYTRLASKLGDDAGALAEKRNAQVAVSKRAQYAYELGRLSEAAESWERLLSAFPREAKYLRRAGHVAYQQKDYAKALDFWRRLLAGSRAGTEEWYEAKYFQLACLLETDRGTAAKVFKQFQLLEPDLGPPTWRTKFQQLQSRL